MCLYIHIRVALLVIHLLETYINDSERCPSRINAVAPDLPQRLVRCNGTNAPHCVPYALAGPCVIIVVLSAYRAQCALIGGSKTDDSQI